jgi:hypothetical protein
VGFVAGFMCERLSFASDVVDYQDDSLIDR